MNGKTAGTLGMVVGVIGILVAGLIDAYTNTLLLCGSIVLSSGIIAVAIVGKTAGSDRETSGTGQDTSS